MTSSLRVAYVDAECELFDSLGNGEGNDSERDVSGCSRRPVV